MLFRSHSLEYGRIEDELNSAGVAIDLLGDLLDLLLEMIIFDLQCDESFVGFLIFLYDQTRNTLHTDQSNRVDRKRRSYSVAIIFLCSRAKSCLVTNVCD